MKGIERPDFRHLRAMALFASVYNIIAPHLNPEEDPRYLQNELMDLLLTEGVEVLTDYTRSEMGLPPRGPDGPYPHTLGVTYMSTSHPISKMSRPRNGEKVPRVTVSYVNSRNRRTQYEFLIQEFKRSGISRSELAVRTGKSLAQISRWLGQPSNMTSDTMSELLFAMRGHISGVQTETLPGPMRA